MGTISLLVVSKACVDTKRKSASHYYVSVVFIVSHKNLTFSPMVIFPQETDDEPSEKDALQPGRNIVAAG